METQRIPRSSRPALWAAAAFGTVLVLPSLVARGGTGAASDLGLARQLADGSLLAFALAFVGGVLTSLTPCVYPLIPITASLFGARRAARPRAFALSALYVLGLATTYAALGASAALGGKAFGTALQSRWTLAAVALFLAIMASSMFGAFELALPASLQTRLTRVGGAGWVGAFGMGLVAGLIAAPCTGPVLGAALAFVATQGSVTYGVAVLFVYALGIGVPFFLIGAFAITLPKSGAWMEAVKRLFGIALLTLALLYLFDVFPPLRAHLSPAPIASVVAALATALGVGLGALQGRGQQRWAEILGVALATAGVVYALGAGELRRAQREGGAIAWEVNAEGTSLARARAEGRPVVIDFWGDWCAACKELDRTAWSDPRVQAALRGFVAVKIDNSASQMADARVAERVDRTFDKYAILGQPTVLFIDARGRELPPATRVTGVIGAEEMLRRLEQVAGACASTPAGCVARW